MEVDDVRPFKMLFKVEVARCQFHRPEFTNGPELDVFPVFIKCGRAIDASNTSKSNRCASIDGGLGELFGNVFNPSFIGRKVFGDMENILLQWFLSLKVQAYGVIRTTVS